MPIKLQHFVRQCWNLSLKSSGVEKEIDDGHKWVKVSPKKVHEVVRFSDFISNDCRQNQVQHVVDIGSGLVR